MNIVMNGDNALACVVSQWMGGLTNFISSILRYGIEVMDMKTITTSNDTLNKINKILPPDSPIYLSLSAIEILFDKRNILITQISIFFLLTLFPTFNFKCVASIWMLWTLLMYLE